MTGTRKKKSLTAKSNIINTKKWFVTVDKAYIYTYLEYKTSNRTIKEEIMEELKSLQINCYVLIRDIAQRQTGEILKSYVVAVPYNSFSETFSHIEAKMTTASFPL